MRIHRSWKNRSSLQLRWRSLQMKWSVKKCDYSMSIPDVIGTSFITYPLTNDVHQDWLFLSVVSYVQHSIKGSLGQNGESCKRGMGHGSPTSCHQKVTTILPTSSMYYTSYRSEWECIDFGTVIIHAFSPRAREYYKIEKLYEKCEEVSTFISQIFDFILGFDRIPTSWDIATMECIL